MTLDFVPGEILPEDGQITLNSGRETTTLRVANAGDRPVQIGSHLHFFEANSALEFDREAAFGMRLSIPAGTATRFEPGDEKTIELVEFGGNRHIQGFNNLTDGDLDSTYDKALERAQNAGFSSTNSSENSTNQDNDHESTDASP